MPNATVQVHNNNSIAVALQDYLGDIPSFTPVNATFFKGPCATLPFVVEFYGDNLTYDGGGTPTGGTITTFLLSAKVTGQAIVGLTFDVPVDASMLIPALADPQALDAFLAAYTYTFTGGSGNETFSGYGGADKFNGFAGKDTFQGNDGDDTINGGDGDDVLDGGVGNDTINGQANDDVLNGGMGDDTLSGGDGDDVLEGGAGTDTLNSGAGGPDGDTLSYQSDTAGVTVNLSILTASHGDAEGDILQGTFGTLIGGSGSDKLEGSANGEIIRGGDAFDTIDGAGGDDVLEGGAGGDIIFSGTMSLNSKDTLSYEHDTVGVTVNLATNTTSGGDAGSDVLFGVFGKLIGGSGDDFLVGRANVDQIIEGRLGNDVINGSTGNDTLDGGEGNDTAIGNDGNDTIAGGLGNDDLQGSGGNDTLSGGDGNDNLNGGGDNDTLNGGAGNDTITGGLGADIMDGGDGDDSLADLLGDGTFLGGKGNDKLEAGNGVEIIDGGADIDELSYGNSSKSVTVTLGVGGGVTGLVAKGDYAEGDTITNVENLRGTSAADALTGNELANVLYGGVGNDTLNGGAGDDNLFGENGIDTIVGGLGNDTVNYSGTSFSGTSTGVTLALGANGAQTIAHGEIGYVEGDKISSVEGIIGSNWADALTGNNLANLIRGGASNDTVQGGAGNDWLSGDDGDDLVEGGAGADTLSGEGNGAGGDTLSYASSAVGVTIKFDAGAQFVVGKGGDAEGDAIWDFEHIVGSAKNDILSGDLNDNVIKGGLGNDTIEGGAGKDTLDGGGGVDTLSYAHSKDTDFNGEGVTVSLFDGANAQANTLGDDAEGDAATNFTNVIGTDFRDSLHGNSSANMLDGGAGNDHLDGGAGNDVLVGGAGDDYVAGDASVDTIVGGDQILGDILDYNSSGAAVTLALGKDGAQTVGKGGFAEGDKVSQIEHIYGSAFDDVLTGNNLDNTFFGNDGDDTLEGGAGGDYLVGGIGIDTLSYAGSAAGVTINLATKQAFGGDAEGDLYDGIEGVLGSAKNDILTGSAGDDAVDGGAGDDVVDGGTGTDTLKGGAGSDTLSYSNSSSAVTVTLDGANPASVTGGDANGDTATNFESLIGTKFNDKLIGDAGNNTIEGGGGDDFLDGGAGNDTVSYAGASAGVTTALFLATQFNTVGAGKDTLANFENVIGSAFDDTLFGDDKFNVISGGEGNDIVVGRAGADALDGGAGSKDLLIYSDDVKGVTVTLGAAGAQTTASGPAGSQAAGDKIMNFEQVRGGDADDKLVGNELDNALNGNGGDDFIQGGKGADVLEGGSHASSGDTLSYANSSSGVTVDLKAGTGKGGDAEGDVLSGFEIVIGSAKDDSLTGDVSKEKIDGGAGNDIVDGGMADDVLIGGTGIDTVSYAGATGAIQVDLTKVGVAQDTGGAGVDTLTGFENATLGDFGGTAIGDNNANTLTGGGGKDTLNGGNGNDTIEGAGDDDTLDGGVGTDIASYAHATAGVTVNLTTVGAEQDTVGAGKDTLQNFENVIGSAHDDELTGDGKANVIKANGGSDTIEGLGGADILDGGPMLSTVSYAHSAAGVTAKLGKDGAQTTGTGGDAQGDKISGFYAISGSGFDDVLTGNDGENVLFGLQGNDLIQGGADADQLSGGGQAGDTVSYASSAGGVTVLLYADVAHGGDATGDQISGFNAIIGSAKNDELAGNNKNNVINGGAGDDVISDYLGDDILTGGAGKDTVAYFNAGSGVTVDLSKTKQQDTIGAGKDTLSGFENIIGGQQGDKLTGSKGANIMDGYSGDDVLDGGAGIDTVSYLTANSYVHVTLAAPNGTAQDTVGAGIDTLSNFENATGSGYDDTLQGNAAANVLDGSVGQDLLIGHGGADTLIGGDGIDAVDYQGSAVGVTIKLGTDGAPTTGIGGDAQGDKFSGIESIFGSSKNDVLAGNNLFNSLMGLDGDDVIFAVGGFDGLFGGKGIDTLNYSLLTHGVTSNIGTNVSNAGDTFGEFENLVGTNFDDDLTGSANGNTINGGAGNDRLEGGAGADVLDGGAGIDTVGYSAAVGVTVTLGAGGAQTIGKGGDAEGDKIANFENLDGGDGDDVLTGNAGNNVIHGGSGDDVIDGGLGNDTLEGNSFSVKGDTLSYAGIAANVTVDFRQSGTAWNTGGAGIDTFFGFSNLVGGGGNDVLTGDNGNNAISGGAGNDTIDGGEGADTLDGGTNGAAGDTLSYANSINDAISIDLTTQGTATVQHGGDAEGDLIDGFENVTGTVFRDVLIGDAGANILSGGASGDTISGGKGADILDGGTNPGEYDTVSYAGSAANVTVVLGANGAETTVAGAAGSDGVGDKIKNFESIIGSDFNDTLTGNGDENLITGGLGSDILTGGGGVGIDNFFYDGAAEGGDIITDFDNDDSNLAVKGTGFGGGLDAFADGYLGSDYFVSGSAPIAAGNLHGYFLFDTDTHKLYWDVDGTDPAGAQLIATFTNGAILTEADIWVF